MMERLNKAVAYIEKKRDAYQRSLDLLATGDMEDLRVAVGDTEVRNAFGGELVSVLLDLDQHYTKEQDFQHLKRFAYSHDYCVNYKGTGFLADISGIQVNFKQKTLTVGYAFLTIPQADNRSHEALFDRIVLLENVKFRLLEAENKASLRKQAYIDRVRIVNATIDQKIAHLKEELVGITEGEGETIRYNRLEADKETELLAVSKEILTLIAHYREAGFAIFLPPAEERRTYQLYDEFTERYVGHLHRHPLLADLKKPSLMERKRGFTYMSSRLPYSSFREEENNHLRHGTVGVMPTALFAETKAEGAAMARPLSEGDLQEWGELFKDDSRLLLVAKTEDSLTVEHTVYPISCEIKATGEITVTRNKEWSEDEPVFTRVGMNAFAKLPSFRLFLAFLARPDFSHDLLLNSI